MSNTPDNWPSTGDQAFTPCLSPAGRETLEVFVMPSEGAYLVAFERAADMIVDAARTERLAPDNLFFPVAYLYRHHLELMLKGLVSLSIRVGCLRSCKKVLRQHSLRKLWQEVRKLIEAVWPQCPDADLEAVEHVILEVDKLDPTGQAFRYARDSTGKDHPEKAPRRVDLCNLKKRINAVSKYLDAAYAGIESFDPGSHKFPHC